MSWAKDDTVRAGLVIQGDEAHSPKRWMSVSPVRAVDSGGSQEPLPIWLAVLKAMPCQARSNGTHHDVRWDCVGGRALYTNYGRDAERIEPLGVSLSVGETLVVYWTAGETAYTMEVYSEAEQCA